MHSTIIIIVITYYYYNILVSFKVSNGNIHVYYYKCSSRRNNLQTNRDNIKTILLDYIMEI